MYCNNLGVIIIKLYSLLCISILEQNQWLMHKKLYACLTLDL